MQSILDEILLSDDVVKDFHKHYNNNNFKEWLLNLLPEIENCKNLKQDNPWHIYNCLDHILHSVENINKQTKDLSLEERKMLAYVMFLHDIGKPECYLRRYSKLYKREVDSFFNHNKASVKIAQRVLPTLGFNDNDIKKMLLLIDEHDAFMFLTLDEDGNKYHKVLTSNVVDEMVDKYNHVGDGEKLLNQLIMVGRADNMSQNPEMTQNSFKLLDKMQQLLDEKNKK